MLALTGWFRHVLLTRDGLLGLWGRLCCLSWLPGGLYEAPDSSAPQLIPEPHGVGHTICMAGKPDKKQHKRSRKQQACSNRDGIQHIRVM